LTCNSATFLTNWAFFVDYRPTLCSSQRRASRVPHGQAQWDSVRIATPRSSGRMLPFPLFQQHRKRVEGLMDSGPRFWIRLWTTATAAQGFSTPLLTRTPKLRAVPFGLGGGKLLRTVPHFCIASKNESWIRRTDRTHAFRLAHTP
jgi:hypothetical protein